MEQDGYGSGLERNAEIGGDGQPHGSVPVIQRCVEGPGDQRDHGPGGHGDEGVAGGVKRARIDGLCRPEKHGDGEDGEVGCALARVGRGEASA